MLRAPAVSAGMLDRDVRHWCWRDQRRRSEHARLDACLVTGPASTSPAMPGDVAEAFPDASGGSRIRSTGQSTPGRPPLRLPDAASPCSLRWPSRCFCRAASSIGWLARGASGRRRSSPPVACTSGRFLRLSRAIGLIYWALGRLLASLPSRSPFVALVLLLIVADFAKARAVVEDRRSMLGALRRVVPVHSPPAFVARALCCPADDVCRLPSCCPATLAAARSGWRPRGSPCQCCWSILFRSGASWRCAASEIVLFQHALAHADYTAAPLPIWPDSPAAEAIENLVQQRERSGPGARGLPPGA